MSTEAEHDELVPLYDGPVASVFAGISNSNGAAYALKVYPDGLSEDDRAELENEFGKLTALRGVAVLLPQVVHELADGRCAVRMELCAQSLPELVASFGALSVSDTLVLGAALGNALSSAHRAGVTHGGVTPGNVLFRPSGEPVLSDFGLALRRAFPREPDRDVDYLAPETARDGTADARSDLYGLGGVLYLALAGESPYQGPLGEQWERRRQRVLETDPAPLRRADLPAGLAALIAELLAKDPEQRPADADRIVGQLNAMRGVSAVPLPDALPGSDAESSVDVVEQPLTDPGFFDLSAIDGGSAESTEIAAEVPEDVPASVSLPDQDVVAVEEPLPERPRAAAGEEATGEQDLDGDGSEEEPGDQHDDRDGADEPPATPFIPPPPMRWPRPPEPGRATSPGGQSPAGTPAAAAPANPAPVQPSPGQPYPAHPAAVHPAAPAAQVPPGGHPAAGYPQARQPAGAQAPATQQAAAQQQAARQQAAQQQAGAQPRSQAPPPLSAQAAIAEAATQPAVPRPPMPPTAQTSSPNQTSPPNQISPEARMSPGGQAAPAGPGQSALETETELTRPAYRPPTIETQVTDSHQTGAASKPPLQAQPRQAQPQQAQPGPMQQGQVTTQLPVVRVPPRGGSGVGNRQPGAQPPGVQPQARPPGPPPGGSARPGPARPGPVGPWQRQSGARPPAGPNLGEPILVYGPEKARSRQSTKTLLFVLGGVVLLAVIVVGGVQFLNPEERMDPPADAKVGVGTTKLQIPKAAVPQLDRVVDEGNFVQLNWSSARELNFAVIVASEGKPRNVLLAHRQNSLRVEVDPVRKYCFSVQGSDGSRVYESEPKPIRGASCEK